MFCGGKEIPVSAKVFIKILRQMISVSFSWSCLGRHAISMQITTSRLCSYYFCWSCCNMTQEREGGGGGGGGLMGGRLSGEGWYELRKRNKENAVKKGKGAAEGGGDSQTSCVGEGVHEHDRLTEVWKYITLRNRVGGRGDEGLRKTQRYNCDLFGGCLIIYDTCTAAACLCTVV